MKEKLNYELNIKNWTKIRNLTKEECVQLGYKSSGHRGVYSCNSCGAKRYIINSHFKTRKTVCDNGCHGIGNNNKLIAGINDLATTHPHLTHYFVDERKATQVSKGSDRKVDLKCPYCGYVKTMFCHSFVDRGFSCPNCSDKFSFAEKFVSNLLCELKLDFKTQFRIENHDYRYDFYIPSLNMIIETHGKQHYEKSFETAGGRSLEEEIKNDEAKEKLAKDNCYNYVVLDCRQSKTNYIKDSILKSNISKMLDLSNVNWEDIGSRSEKSLVIEVVDYYKKTNESTYAIGDKFGISSSTVSRYLKKAEESGLCTFVSKENKPCSVVMVNQSRILKIANSARQMGKEIEYSCSSIAKLANGKGATGKTNSHFTNSKKFGYIGFYYLDSKEWERVKYQYV